MTGKKIADRWPEWEGWRMAQAFREKAGLTQAQAAEKANLSRDWVTKMETGRQANPPIRALIAYAQAIGVPVSALL